MIRDPSDGTVREKPVLETATSGLPKQQKDEIDRLNRSRDWLKSYRVTASRSASPEE